MSPPRKFVRIVPPTLLLAAAVLISLHGCGVSGGGDARPNVLLITIDTLRADRLGCYGNAEVRTPVIDALADQGVLFTQSFAHAPMTLPSHASILTGLQPHSHGIRLNGHYRLPESIPTLATILAGADYATGAFVSARVLHSRYGLARGFDRYDDRFTIVPPSRLERPGDETIARSLEWIRSVGDKPFFAWVHIFEPHFPYDPPEPYRTRCVGRPYDGEVEWSDELVGRLVAGLRESGSDENTWIVLTSDHGEALGEHGEETHALLVYDSTIRVPLIVRPPTAERPIFPAWTPGSRFDVAVQSVDIVPTLLDGTGIESAARFDGETLRDPGSIGPRLAWAESFYGLSFGWSPLVSLRGEREKYIRGSKESVFDYRSDPGELTDLNSDPRKAEDYRTRTETILAAGPVAREADSPGAADIAALEGLGYIGAGPASRAESEGENLDFTRPDPGLRIRTFELINDARSMSGAGMHDAAARLLEPFAEEEADNPVFLQVLGTAHLEAGRPGPALALLGRFHELRPDYPEAPAGHARALLMSGDIEGAREILLECAEAFPDYGGAWDLLAVAHGMAGDRSEAVRAAERAVELDPGNTNHRRTLGTALLNSGDAARAEKEFRAILEVGGEPDAPAMLGLGRALNAQSRFAESCAVLRGIAPGAAEYPEAMQRLMVALYHTGRTEELRDAGRKLEEAGILDGLGAFYLGRADLDADRAEQALGRFVTTMDDLPGFAAGYVAAADALVRIGVVDPRAATIRERAAAAGVELPAGLGDALAALVPAAAVSSQ